ncbi:MAG TPA: T9SS type A sorting domain-containing protein [Bacteroidales bacterium]|nr:T9SS type A sorting domain-containing protein [Bacteroidales bacterium]
MKKIYTILVLSFLIIPFFNIKSQAQIPTVQYTPLAPYYYTHNTIYDTARVYSNGLIDQLCAIHYSIYKDDTLTPITSVDDYGSIEYTVRSYSTNYLTQSITNGTGYLSVRPLFTTYNAFTLGIFDNYCVSRNRPVMLEMVFDEPGYYKFYCEIQSCSNSGSSLGTSFTANGAPGCGTTSHSDYAATSCDNATPLFGEALYLTICEQGSIAYSSGNTTYCPGEAISLVYTLGTFNDLADTTGLPSWLTPAVDVLAQTLTLTGTAPIYDPANPTCTFPVSSKISVNPNGCPADFVSQTITIIDAPTPVIAGDNFICEGSSIELLSDLKGTWTSTDGSIVTIDQTAPDSAVTITGLSDGVINIFCEATSGGCTVNSQPFSIIVHPVIKDTITTTICSNDQYLIGAVAYNTAGTFTDTLISSNGCDSIVTLHLSVNPVSDSALTETICQNNPFSFGGEFINISGIYKDTLVNALGCDSIVTLNLTVNDTSFSEFWITDTSYTWNTIAYTESGDYEQTLLNAYGCDSVVTLHLTVVTGIENNELNAEIYPNPAEDYIHIILNSKINNTQLKLFNSEGILIKSYNMAGNKFSIELSSLAPGLYFLTISDSKGHSATYRFSKQ